MVCEDVWQYCATPGDRVERACGVALSSLAGIGPTRANRLLAVAGSYEAAWAELDSHLAGAGIPTAMWPRLLAARATLNPEECMDRLDRLGVRAAFPGDPGYPAGFTAMRDPPAVVYIRGELSAADRTACAVVGTRLASPYGRWVTTKIASGLGRARVTVVSGLARGIDAAAHSAALAAGGRTVAVLAGGLDKIYPPEHEPLAARIQQAGALISEYYPGKPTAAGNFLARNRLIAAMGLATVVCEAGRRSGAMVTAKLAAENGRDVLAVPGRVGDPGASGVNELIRDGAGLVQSAQDVLTALGLAVARLGCRDDADQSGAGCPAAPVSTEGLSDLGKILVAGLVSGPRREDQLISVCGGDAGRVRAELVMLELMGRVVRWPGGQYSLR